MIGFVALILFLLGFAFIFKRPIKESMNIIDESECPDVLIQEGGKYFLRTTNAPEVPGKNPIIFDNLDDYEQYVDWIRSKGKTCPILKLRVVDTVQGDEELHIVDEINHPSKGPRTEIERALNNRNNFPVSYDQMNQNIGVHTSLDDKYSEKESLPISDNAMDSNWGGIQYARQEINRGVYGKNKINRKRRKHTHLYHPSP